MNKFGFALSPVIGAAVIFSFSGVATAQTRHVAGAQCPPPKVMQHKITEIEAVGLAQEYADKNLKGFKVVKPTTNSGGRKPHQEPAYGGGYVTQCFGKEGDMHNSVEYSFDVKNPKGSMRILTVDQFGYVSQYHGMESATR